MKKYEMAINEMLGRMNIEVGVRKSEKEDLDDYELNNFVWGEYGERIMFEVLGEVYGISESGDNFEECFKGYMEYVGYCVINFNEMELMMMGLWWFNFMGNMSFNGGRKINDMIKKNDGGVILLEIILINWWDSS